MNDCALFAASAIEAMTGNDPAARWRGRYHTRAGAGKIVQREGWDGLAGMAAAHLPEVAIARADIGDIAVIWTENGPGLALVAGPLLAAPGPDGLHFGPRQMMRRSFHLPHPGEVC